MKSQVTLMERLTLAASMLLSHRLPDSSAAVSEAQEVIRALPFAEDINEALYPSKEYVPSPVGDMDKLRELRAWHYAQYIDYNNRSREMQQKSDSRMFSAPSRNDFERVANEYSKKANRHLRFVRSLNEFFPITDRVA